MVGGSALLHRAIVASPAHRSSSFGSWQSSAVCKVEGWESSGVCEVEGWESSGVCEVEGWQSGTRLDEGWLPAAAGFLNSAISSGLGEDFDSMAC